MNTLYTTCLRVWKLLVASPKWFFLSLFFLSVVLYSLRLVPIKSILWGDTRYYYAYTRSLLIDRDLDFSNEASRLEDGFPHNKEISTITGRVVNKFSIGAPLLWIPGFVVGEAVSWIVYGLFAYGPAPDGYGLITQWFTAVSALAYAVGGFYYLYLSIVVWLHHEHSISKLQSRSLSLAVVIVLYLSTQLFFYTSLDPLNSHTTSFFLSSLLLFLVTKLLYGKSQMVVYWVLGVVAGLLFLVRNQDVLIVLPLVSWMIISVVVQFKKKRTVNFDMIKGLGVILLFLLLALGIQQLVVWHLFGRWGSPYLIRGETLAWLRPDVIRVLFSSGNGLFFFAPVTLLASAGLSMLAQNKSRVGVLGLWVFLLQLYIIAAWGKEIVGGPYGSRMFVSSLPWLALGLVPIIEVLQKRHGWRAVVLLVSVFFLNNIIQTGIMLARY